MSDEELIEKAAKAMIGAAGDTWDDATEDEKDWYLRDARAALAVFREHTAPTDDRDELARTLFITSDDFAFAQRMAKAWDSPEPHGRARWYRYADAILAAGFRRGAPAEPAVTGTRCCKHEKCPGGSLCCCRNDSEIDALSLIDKTLDNIEDFRQDWRYFEVADLLRDIRAALTEGEKP